MFSPEFNFRNFGLRNVAICVFVSSSCQNLLQISKSECSTAMNNLKVKLLPNILSNVFMH